MRIIGDVTLDAQRTEIGTEQVFFPTVEIYAEFLNTLLCSEARFAALREEIELVYPLFASENDVEDIHHLLEFKNELVLADENY